MGKLFNCGDKKYFLGSREGLYGWHSNSFLGYPILNLKMLNFQMGKKNLKEKYGISWTWYII